MKLLPNEQIKDIQGYEGLYAITSFGRVWSYANKKNHTHNGKWLKICNDSDGYCIVGLSHNGKTKTHKVHRLVALSFIGESTLQVNHIGGNKKNNCISNLEWVTGSQNQLHARQCGLILTLIGKKQSRNTSGYVGVSWHKRNRKWTAQIRISKKLVHLGSYDSAEDASTAYNQMLEKIRCGND